jgi:hypothetical protein
VLSIPPPSPLPWTTPSLSRTQSALEEETICTGIGYAAHMVVELARLLDAPLRFPIQAIGSRATITHHTTPMGTQTYVCSCMFVHYLQ